MGHGAWGILIWTNGGHSKSRFLRPKIIVMLARDVTTAQLIVGKRHCRVLTLGNINSGVTGFDMKSS